MLVDGMVIDNEMIDLTKRLKKTCFIFKIDFEKAFALVKLGFLDYILHKFRFNEK